MKHTLFSFLGFVLLAIVGCTDNSHQQEVDAGFIEKEVKRIMGAQELAWNSGDIEEFMEYYWKSDSTGFGSINGVRRGWETIYNGYRTQFPDLESMGTLKFELQNIQPINPKQALVQGKWHLDRQPTDAGGGFLLLFSEVSPDEWKIVYDYTHSVPQD